MKTPLLLSLTAGLTYAVLNYGGIRSPDCEVVYRTAETLATQGTFAQAEEFHWQGFGFVQGKDNRLYSLFGPAESVAAVPLVWMAEALEGTGWYPRSPGRISPSFYVGEGFAHFVQGTPPVELAPHARRALVSLLNPIVCALCVFVFYRGVERFTKSSQAALLTSLLFAGGSLLVPYSGTLFSECLATLFGLLSLVVLLDRGDQSCTPRQAALSGLWLGLATTTHLTAILFAPFFALYAMFARRRFAEPWQRAAGLNGLAYSLGFGMFLALIAGYNQARFGSILETGRTVDPEMVYAVFVAPWRGIYGLLLGSGKGLFLYCPAVVVSLICWKPFHQKDRLLSCLVLGAALFRVVFIASRSDWHGGFCLGPRYLVMLIPFLLLPLGAFIARRLEDGSVRAAGVGAAVTLACIAQQLYFSLGEIFSYLHIVKLDAMNQGIDVFVNDALYFDWSTTPLLYLLNGLRGPALLRSLPLGNYALWFSLVVVAGGAVYWVYRPLVQGSRTS